MAISTPVCTPCPEACSQMFMNVVFPISNRFEMGNFLNGLQALNEAFPKLSKEVKTDLMTVFIAILNEGD